MSKNVKSSLDSEARALEREARAAKADMEQLVQEFAALPADARATIRGRIESGRNRLEAIAVQAERALADRRDDLAANLVRFDRQLEGQIGELERRAIEAAKGEAEAAYEVHRNELENARLCAREGVEFSVESLSRYSRALETSG